MSRNLSRRTFLKTCTFSTTALYLQGCMGALGRGHAASSARATQGFEQFSPVDRGIHDSETTGFSGDDPAHAHPILWDAPAYLREHGLALPETSERVPLVIVGGGMSGLAMAYLLQKYDPVLLEQAPRFGGNSRAESWRGIDYAIGAAYFVGDDAGSELQNLIEELELHRLWRETTDEDPVELHQKVLSDFWNGESAPGAAAQFARIAQYFQSCYDGEIPYPEIPTRDPAMRDYVNQLDRRTLKAHLEAVVGGALHPHLAAAIEFYCWSSFGGSATEVSAAAGLNFLAAEFGPRYVLPGGNAAAAEQILRLLARNFSPDQFRPSSIVFDVREVSDGVIVTYLDAAGALHSLHADAVVMACPKFVVRRILRDIEPEREAAILRLQYRSYLVANALLDGSPTNDFYDLYLLGDADLGQRDRVTDVICANFAAPNKALRQTPSETSSVLTLYRSLPYAGARAALLAPDAYTKLRGEFDTQLRESILPLLGYRAEQLTGLRLARWGHPLPLAAAGLISDGVVDALRKPFRERVFFAEQDNWALPAFETALAEALNSAPAIARQLEKRRNA